MAKNPSNIQLQPERKEVIQNFSELPFEIRRAIWKFAAEEALKVFYVNNAQDTSIFLSDNSVGGIVRKENTHNWPNTFELPHLRRLTTLKKKDLVLSLLHVDREAREAAWKAYIVVTNDLGFLGHFFKVLYTRRYRLSKSVSRDRMDNPYTIFADPAKAMKNLKSRMLINPGMGYDWTNSGAVQLLTDVHETLQSRLMEPPGSSFWALQLVLGAEESEAMDKERGNFTSDMLLPQPSPEPKLWELRNDAFEPTFVQDTTAYLDNFDMKYIIRQSLGLVTTLLHISD
ncbi:uncharacterized protein EAE97_006945 [Botrytis byssoidea]|uniref:2EXR domain-containing protein n=1 Tax=Botrytis byssoidea TaxID=139641 RepID=A0A9P5INQ8_9HELO|nr:uncharacterized protein EAE97_006945 [Botrytis byssoidea]KAF7940759.1 hypothetical protein EAE97_006945 [Botrytis byssoidea]